MTCDCLYFLAVIWTETKIITEDIDLLRESNLIHSLCLSLKTFRVQKRMSFELEILLWILKNQKKRSYIISWTHWIPTGCICLCDYIYTHECIAIYIWICIYPSVWLKLDLLSSSWDAHPSKFFITCFIKCL